jgi:hypothetical protein
VAEFAMAIAPIRGVVFANFWTLRDLYVLRRVSKNFKAYIDDEALAPELKLILQGRAGSSMASSHEPVSACVAKKIDALVRRARGKPFCQLDSAVAMGMVAYRCQAVLPGAWLSKEAICDITGNTPTSSGSMWNGALDVGVLAHKPGQSKHGGGWRAGGAWEGWLSVRIHAPTCDDQHCQACTRFQALLLPRCTMEPSSAQGGSGVGGVVCFASWKAQQKIQRRASRQPYVSGGPAWRLFRSRPERARCTGCSGHCDSWREISVMRDCLAAQQNRWWIVDWPHQQEPVRRPPRKSVGGKAPRKQLA